MCAEGQAFHCSSYGLCSIGLPPSSPIRQLADWVTPNGKLPFPDPFPLQSRYSNKTRWKWTFFSSLTFCVPRGRIELPTQGFSTICPGFPQGSDYFIFVPLRKCEVGRSCRVIVGTHLLVSTPSPVPIAHWSLARDCHIRASDVGFLEFTRYILPHYYGSDRKSVLCSTTELPRHHSLLKVLCISRG
jgi:hypothetical protein